MRCNRCADVVMSTSAVLQQGPPFFAFACGDDALDGAAGLQIGRPVARLDESGGRGGPVGACARELHQGSRELYEDDDQHAIRRAIEDELNRERSCLQSRA